MASETPAPIEFVRDVAPIFREHCVRCHHSGNRKGDFSLSTRKEVEDNDTIVRGDPESSYLLDLVTPATPGDSPEMPKGAAALSTAQREILRRWIASGAAWSEGVTIREASKANMSWWSLRPLSSPEPPVTSSAPGAWQQNPIDGFVYARLAQAELAPSPPADKRTLIRRVTYDVTGLPPTPDQVEAFVSD